MSEIRAGTTSTTALVSTGDTTGNIVLTPDSGVATINATGALTVPSGTTAQRPASPANGMTRYNTTTSQYEVYVNGWASVASGTYVIDYLIVAGGGGGGQGRGAGGGAGGMLTGTSTITRGTVYSVVIGAGGTGGTLDTGTGSWLAYGVNGNNSNALLLTAVGGGYGGMSVGGNGGNTARYSGSSGGSGGGAGSNYYSYNPTVGSATSGQGFAGGLGYNGGEPYNGGSGGGAGAAGTAAQNAVGGIGLQSSITGTATYYAGGGGAGSYQQTAGAGGNGGGGAGGTTTAGTAGTANTGGGGGGGGNVLNGGAGGSGVVIFSIPTVSYSGTTTGSPTITINGLNTIIKFTSSGSYTA